MRYLTLGIIVLALLLGASGLWIQAKAQLGQILLETAWNKTLATRTVQKPWPWADTWPVAKVIVPSLERSFIVLDGVSGEAMAFGPGTINTISADDAEQLIAIGGHRDSHMQFLEHLKLDNIVHLQLANGTQNTYRVNRTIVANSAHEKLAVPADKSLLVMITCYPFNALQTGGPMRYVVIAEPIW